MIWKKNLYSWGFLKIKIFKIKKVEFTLKKEKLTWYHHGSIGRNVPKTLLYIKNQNTYILRKNI